MKTRYFKSGILAAAAALLCSAALVSCTDDVTVGEWDGAGSIETGLNETGAMLQDLNSGKSNTTVELWKETYTADLRLVLTKTPSEGFTARAKVDDSYDVGQYNKANGTNYTLYPADKVTFANDGLFAAAGRNVELTVGMTVHAAEGLVAGRGYLIPVALEADGVILKESHCFYVVKDMTSMPTCYKGDDLPKGFLFFEVNDVNPLNALTFELEDGRLLWDVVCLFSGNINHHADRNAPFLSLNPQTQYWMDNNEVFIQPLRKRGIKVIMCVLGNHDQSGVAQLSDYGCQMFAKELATFCEAYNIDGVCFDDEYSNSPDLSNPYYASRSSARAARLAYESKKAMPDKLVVAYCYSSFHISSWPTEIEGQDIAEWVDIAVGDYGQSTSPKGNMTQKQCSAISMEFNRGTGGNFTSGVAEGMLNPTTGKGWFMGFAPDPLKNTNGRVDKNAWRTIFVNRLNKGPETLYGSPLKEPEHFYKFADTTRYNYPEDLPDTYSRPAQPEWPNY